MRTRQIVLDTETTGLEPEQGHRIIEIGCVELIDRRPSGRNFHQYLQPDREIDARAVEVHGITNAFLADKPRFGDIAADLLEYLKGAELIIHNAPFDTGFLNAELARVGPGEPVRIETCCTVTDTLVLARRLHPGQRNSLDALCTRYRIDNSHREKHGALLDAEILADVYLAMTGGQTTLSLEGATDAGARRDRYPGRRPVARVAPLRVVSATEAELDLHANRLAAIDKASGGRCLWLSEESYEKHKDKSVS
jgi:DNA polymerase-3 subunit epsilon